MIYDIHRLVSNMRVVWLKKLLDQLQQVLRSNHYIETAFQWVFSVLYMAPCRIQLPRIAYSEIKGLEYELDSD